MIVALVLWLVAVAINLAIGYGVLLDLGRPVAWLATLAAFIAALAAIGYAVQSRWDGAFIDKYNRISLSRFQVILWTVVVVSGLFTAGLTNIAQTLPDGMSGPLDIQIPPEIWALLGLGAFSAVAAPVIAGRQEKREPEDAEAGKDGAPAPTSEQRSAVETIARKDKLSAPGAYAGVIYKNADPGEARWINLVRGDHEGAAYVDISKVQKLAFTILLVAIYCGALWSLMQGGDGIAAFPAVDSGFVALLAISHAAYLADKQSGRT